MREYSASRNRESNDTLWATNTRPASRSRSSCAMPRNPARAADRARDMVHPGGTDTAIHMNQRLMLVFERAVRSHVHQADLNGPIAFSPDSIPWFRNQPPRIPDSLFLQSHTVFQCKARQRNHRKRLEPLGFQPLSHVLRQYNAHRRPIGLTSRRKRARQPRRRQRKQPRRSRTLRLQLRNRGRRSGPGSRPRT